MARNFTALIAGILFGIGLAVSQMVNPEKVIGFLDLFGQWDPSLAFVMGGALIVTMLGYRFATSKPQPVFEREFRIPANKQIDGRLAIGSVLFGMGWGLVGLCPGPAVAALLVGGLPVFVFFSAMIVGMALFELFDTRLQPPNQLSKDSSSVPQASGAGG